MATEAAFPRRAGRPAAAGSRDAPANRSARLLGRCVAAIALLCMVAAARADPALWVARSPTAIIYLFGTVHVLPAGVEWHYPTLDAALAASGTLYLEEDNGSPATLRALVSEYGINDSGSQTVALDFSYDSPWAPQLFPVPSDSLAAQLDARDRLRLQAVARESSMPDKLAVLDRMRPWLAALTIAFAPVRKAGYDPRRGVDRQLEHAFQAAGKPVGAFETAAQQVQFFADMPRPLQLRFLHKVLVDYAAAPDEIQTLVEDWQAGDVAGIAGITTHSLRGPYPNLYRVLLVDRNRVWATQISDLMRRHGTIFIAVGAAHLAGPDSLQVQLARLGIATQRVH